jgi:DNA repair protein RadC
VNGCIREVEVRYKRSTVPLQRGTRFQNSRGVFEAFREDIMSFPVEVLRVVFLNTKNEMV